MTSAISTSQCRLICQETMKTPDAAINLAYNVQKGFVIIGGIHAFVGVIDTYEAIRQSLKELGIQAKLITSGSESKLVLTIKEFASLRLVNGLLQIGIGTGFMVLGLINMGVLNWNDGLSSKCNTFCTTKFPNPTPYRGCSWDCLNEFQPQDGIISSGVKLSLPLIMGSVLVCDTAMKTTFAVMSNVKSCQDEAADLKSRTPLSTRRWLKRSLCYQAALSATTAVAVLVFSLAPSFGSSTTVYGKERDMMHSDSWVPCQTLCKALNMTFSP